MLLDKRTNVTARPPSWLMCSRVFAMPCLSPMNVDASALSSSSVLGYTASCSSAGGTQSFNSSYLDCVSREGGGMLYTCKQRVERGQGLRR
jgi:hypothetical protein